MALDVISLRTEKFSLEKELDIKAKEILLLEKKQLELNCREEILQAEMEVLSMHLGNLKKKHDELEEEKAELCLETMKLDYLYCFFKSLSSDRLTELKCLSKDLDSIRFIQNGLETEINRLNRELSIVKSENSQLLKLIAHLEEEYKESLLHLEFDLNTSRSFYEELELQLQNVKVQLIEKETQLLEANRKVEFSQGEKKEIQILVQSLQLENKEVMQAREELEKTITILSEVVTHKNKETRSLHESGEMLQKEVDRLQMRENTLILELEKQINEVDISAGKIAALSTDIQILNSNAATCTEKVQDTIVEEEIHFMVEKQILAAELNLTNNYVHFLKTELDNVVAQKRALMNDMGIYPPKITSLWNAIACLEEEVTSITNPKPLENQNRKEDIPLVSNQHCGNQLDEEHLDKTSGVLELEKMILKVETLQRITSEARTVLKEERLDSCSRLEAACKEIEELKMKSLSRQPEIQRNSDSINSLAHDRGVDDDKISKDKYGQEIKDIPLDEASSPLPRMHTRQGGENVAFDDKLWEAAERDYNDKTWKVPPVAVPHDMEIVEEEKNEFPSSELAPEKELNMLERTLTSKNDWNEGVLKELTSDAVRLSGIMSNVEVLNKKMENIQSQDLPPNFGYGTIKAQLKEAEGTALELIDSNRNLIRKAQEHSSFEDEDAKSDGAGSKGRRISEQARRASEKVVRLEFELQKIQYVLLKLEDEHEHRRVKAAQRRTRVMLRDYLYGRKDNHRKQNRFCGCMRPKTTDDH